MFNLYSCSRDCIIEENYICKSGSKDNKDQCFGGPFVSNFTALSINQLELRFNQEV